MKASEQFIKRLEAYLDTEFNDYSKNRIIGFLDEYRASIPPIVIKEKSNIREMIINQVVPEPPKQKEILNGLPVITDEILFKEATAICKAYDIPTAEFFNTKKYKSSTLIVGLRKAFCKKISNNYFCSNNLLASFFNVDHSTISFYLNGKKRNRNIKKAIKN